MKKTLLAALLGAATLVPFAAHAEGTYVKLGVGRSESKHAFESGDSAKGTGGTLGIGFSVDKTWDMELGYVNFGKDEQTTVFGGVTSKNSVKAQSVYLAAIGKVPAGESFSFFGKAGVAVTESKLNSFTSAFGGSTNSSDSTIKTGLLVGAGVAYQFTKDVAVTLDYTYYHKPAGGDSKLSLVTLGLNYGF